MVKVKVSWYKKSGKWYTDGEFEIDTNCWDTKGIESYIDKQAPICKEMCYVYEATDDDNCCNMRMVIKEG